jgi:hypothetical protein
MHFQVKIDEILAQLEQVRKTKGEEVYAKAKRDLALSVILNGNGEAFVKNAFPDLDIAELKKEATELRKQQPAFQTESGGLSPEAMMMQMLKQQVPSIRTQMHLNTFIGAFDALRVTIDGYYTGNIEQALKAREALDKALDMARDVKMVVERLEEIPEADRSPQARASTAEPKQFLEYDHQKTLLLELGRITSRVSLEAWYTETKPVRDLITDQKLRNELHDAIRAKRNDLAEKEQN